MQNNITIADILDGRHKTHGHFPKVADRAMRLEAAALAGVGSKLTMAQMYAIKNILFKVARIVEGDPSFEDHWDDIQGYAALAVRANGGDNA